MPEDPPPDVAEMASDALDEGPENPATEGTELTGRVSEEVKFHERVLEARVDDGKPELATFDDGKPEEARSDDNGPNAGVLDKLIGPLTLVEGSADEEFHDGPLDNGRPEDGGLTEDDDDFVRCENDETRLADVEDSG